MSNLREILINKKICKSIWFMRQAGRYLPEFKKIRSQNQNFIELCLNSELSSQITLQPIKRFYPGFHRWSQTQDIHCIFRSYLC